MFSLTLILIHLQFIGFAYLKECGEVDFPDKFYLRGQWEAYWHETVLVTPKSDSSEDESIGKFETICLSMNGDIELTDDNGNLVGYTDKRTAFEWGVEINIHDCNGNKKYIVDEAQPVLNSINPVGSVYEVYKADKNGEKGKQLGFSEKDKFFDTEISLYNMDNELVVTGSKKYGDDLAAKFGSDTSWKIKFETMDDPLSDPYLISYIVSLKEVQDRIDSEDKTSDACTSWTIAGIIIGCMIVIALIAGAVWFFIFRRE